MKTARRQASRSTFRAVALRTVAATFCFAIFWQAALWVSSFDRPSHVGFLANFSSAVVEFDGARLSGDGRRFDAEGELLAVEKVAEIATTGAEIVDESSDADKDAIFACDEPLPIAEFADEPVQLAVVGSHASDEQWREETKLRERAPLSYANSDVADVDRKFEMMVDDALSFEATGESTRFIAETGAASDSGSSVAQASALVPQLGSDLKVPSLASNRSASGARRGGLRRGATPGSGVAVAIVR